MIRPGKLHHAALRVADFERSRAFYEELLGMSTVPRPDLGFPGAWYGLGDGQHRDGQPHLHRTRHLPGDRDDRQPQLPGCRKRILRDWCVDDVRFLSTGRHEHDRRSLEHRWRGP